MKNFLLITIFSLVLTACGDKGGDGGGGGTTPPPTTAKCQDPDASNFGFNLPCICPGGFIINGDGTACNPNGGSTGGSGGSGGGTAPSALFYSVNPYTTVVNKFITGDTLAPSVNNCTGGCTFSTNFGADANGHGLTGISGVTINKNSGVIQGTTPSNPISRSITVTATNAFGSTSVSLNMNVIQRPPAGLSIAQSNVSYRVGQTISNNNISYTSGPGSITSMNIAPSLPAGLNLQQLDSTSWAITGTPSISSAATNYTITACGPTSPCATLNLSIATQAPPTSFTFNIAGHPNCVSGSGGVPECTFSMLQSFPDINFVVNGDNPQFEILSGGVGAIPSNEFPAGIAMASTGKIYTTSYGAFENTGGNFLTYTLRAYNGVGSVNAQIKIKVLPPAAATGFSYAGSPFMFRVLTPITTLVPTFDNGRAPNCTGQSGCFTVVPALPSGLTMSALNGQITGSADRIAIQAPTTYTIYANQIDGGAQLSTTISIEIKERLPVFAYNMGGNYTFVKSQAIQAAPALDQNPATSIPCNENENNRMPITSFSISPPLPTGLSLNTGAFTCGVAPATNGGSITGTPTSNLALTEYTVTGCNSGGCATAKIYIEIPQNIQKIVAGENHACALVKDGNLNPAKVMCWGANDKGQLGYSSAGTCSATSGNISCSRSGNFVSLPANNVVDISAGKNHTCAILDTNTNDDANESGLVGGPLYCWGDNSQGQLGIGSTTPAFSQSPLQVTFASDTSNVLKATKISSGGNSSCMTAEESITFDAAPEGSPPDIQTNTVTAAVYCVGENYGNRALRIQGSGTPSQRLYAIEVSSGEAHACSVVVSADDEGNFADTDIGKVKCWGKNDVGQFGNGTTNASFSLNPVFVKTNGSTDLNNVGSLTSGGSHNCVKNLSKNVFCWGNNSQGQLALGSTATGLFAAQMLKFNEANVLNTALNLGSMKQSSLVVVEESVSDGLGGNTIVNKLALAGKYALPGALYSGNNSSRLIKIKRDYGANNGGAQDFSVSTIQPSIGPSADNFACVKDVMGSLFCWGKNDAGQLGDGQTADDYLPRRVILNY